MRKLMLLAAIVALLTLTLALPAVANQGSDNATNKWDNASGTGHNHWAEVTEDQNTRTGWCVTTFGKGSVPAVCSSQSPG